MECSRCGGSETFTHRLWHKDAEAPNNEPVELSLCNPCYSKLLQFLQSDEELEDIPLDDFRKKPREQEIDRID